MFYGSWFRRVLPVALVAAIAVPAVARGQGIKQPHAPVPTVAGDIAKARTAFVEAFNSKDAAAINAMYTADAMVINADGSRTVGAAAIAKMNNDSAATWPHAVVASQNLKVYGTTAIDIGTWTVHPSAGGEQVARYVVVLRREVTGWKIQDIASVPMRGGM